MGPGELFEFYMQHLFEAWADSIETYGDFTKDDLYVFCKQDPFLERVFEEFNSWRELQA